MHAVQFTSRGATPQLKCSEWLRNQWDQWQAWLGDGAEVFFLDDQSVGHVSHKILKASAFENCREKCGDCNIQSVVYSIAAMPDSSCPCLTEKMCLADGFPTANHILQNPFMACVSRVRQIWIGDCHQTSVAGFWFNTQ